MNLFGGPRGEADSDERFCKDHAGYFRRLRNCPIGFVFGGKLRSSAPRNLGLAAIAVLTPVLLTATGAAAVAPNALSVPSTWKGIDLGTLGGQSAEAIAVNDAGEVAGNSATSGEQGSEGFYWSHATGMVGLGYLPGHVFSYVTAMNQHGQVVGYNTQSDVQNPEPFSWTLSGGMEEVGPSGTIGEASAVNGRGQVVGYITNAQYRYEAFLWTPKRGITPLGTLGGDASYATAINDKGQVVGWSFDESGDAEAFSWTASGGMVALGPQTDIAVAVKGNGQVIANGLGDPQDAYVWTQKGGLVDLGTLGGNDTQALAENNDGDIVGSSTVIDDGSENGEPFLWTPSAGIIDIGPPSDQGVANAVNSAGDVVGSDGDETTLAFSWTSSGGMVDLGTLGGSYSEATAVNKNGDVVGWSDLSDGSTVAVMWRPTRDG
jgi:probable HAF family extracellular repeat protein